MVLNINYKETSTIASNIRVFTLFKKYICMIRINHKNKMQKYISLWCCFIKNFRTGYMDNLRHAVWKSYICNPCLLVNSVKTAWGVPVRMYKNIPYHMHPFVYELAKCILS